MMPYFRASGNSLWNVFEYNFDKNGYFTIRRRDEFISGTWKDMCIEQSANKRLKIKGCIIHRRFTEDVLTAHVVVSPARYLLITWRISWHWFWNPTFSGWRFEVNTSLNGIRWFGKKYRRTEDFFLNLDVWQPLFPFVRSCPKDNRFVFLGVIHLLLKTKDDISNSSARIVQTKIMIWFMVNLNLIFLN